MSKWNDLLSAWKSQYGISVRPKGSIDSDSVALLQTDGASVFELKEIYRCCNGFFSDAASVLPIFDPKNAKKTWDSLEKANNPAVSGFFSADPVLLSRFLVFGRLQGGGGLAINRNDQRLWYEADGELHETEYELSEFLLAALKDGEYSA